MQCVDDLAIGTGGEAMRSREPALEFAVVVDLAVDRQHQVAIGRTQWLRTTGMVDDGQPLVHQDRAVVMMDAAPVGTTVALLLRKLQRLPSQGLDVVAGLQPEDAEDGTHGWKLLVGFGNRVRKRKKPASCDAGFWIPAGLSLPSRRAASPASRYSGAGCCGCY